MRRVTWGVDKMRLAIASLVALLFATDMAHADIVHLSCTGKIDWTKPGNFETQDVGPIATAIDIDRGTVTFGGHKPWRIIKDGRENFVSFEGRYIDDTGSTSGTKGAWIYAGGLIDRVTGKAELWSRKTSVEGPILGTFDLICKPARPLF